MSAFSVLFEAVVAGLMVALIVYCMRLDRRLRALRENDSAIRALIGELRTAADRAEAAVGALKTAGLEAERSLNQAIRTAQAAEDDLIRRGRPPIGASASPIPPAAPAPRGAARPPVAPSVPAAQRVAEPRPARPSGVQNRSAAERDLLRAIRVARAEGQG